MTKVLDYDSETQTFEETNDGGLSWFDEDPRRETALEETLRGTPKTQIARDLGIGRATLYRWLEHPAFLDALNVRLTEMTTRRRLKRFHETTQITDYLTAKARRLIKRDLEEMKREDEEPAYIATDYGEKIAKTLQSYRAMREEERKDAGENTVNVAHQIHAGTPTPLRSDFGSLVAQAFGRQSVTARDLFVGVNMRVENVSSPEDALQTMTQKDRLLAVATSLLTSTDLVDRLMEEEAEDDG